jgi:sugar/nucleoside kinase (ribokinase family)
MSNSSAGLARRTADSLLHAGEQIHGTPSLVGFDGFIDTILHVVDTRQSATEYTRVHTLDAFGRRIVAAAGKSTNIEIVAQDVKLGGNGPIMANALASMGVPVTYCGMTGYPNTHEVFRQFEAQADLLPLAEPALTDAYEFDDGKLIVGKHATVAEVSYHTIVARVGEDRWWGAWHASKFVGMVNWTMLPYLTQLWKTLQTNEDSLESMVDRPRKKVFIDLADPEKRTQEDLLEGLQTLAKFQKHHDVILGLNEKEAMQVSAALEIHAGGEDASRESVIGDLSRLIREKLGISVCVVHPTAFAAASDAQSTFAVPGPYTPNPKISTGAGDHFNAGFCIGQMAGLDLEQSLQIGVATSGYYVRNAASPSRLQLVEFLREL